MSFFKNQTKKKAVAYYRHSAEDKQENSVPIQRNQAQRFADEHGIEIIHEEADEGKSGLTANRPGFQRLFSEWILNVQAPEFEYILVLDVSRWGRFQDADEPAHYEFLCKERGKRVVYVSRGFPRVDESPISQLEKPFQRIMAAQYSAELSDKVFKGCVEISRQGYSNGGVAPYGLARMLLDTEKKPMRLLKRGEHKCIANERVAFVPANDETTDAVRFMFTQFAHENREIEWIAESVNNKGIVSATGGTWNRGKLLRILANEVYNGTLIYNKTGNRLKKGLHRNPPSEWIRTENVIPAIVDRETFEAAQERLYWTLPSRCRAGTRAIARAKRIFRQELEAYVRNIDCSELERRAFTKYLPTVFCTRIHDENKVPKWCFIINEDLRRFDAVLGVGVGTANNDVIDRTYYLPTELFTPSGYLILSDAKLDQQMYRIQEEAFTGRIDELLDSVRKDLEFHPRP